MTKATDKTTQQFESAFVSPMRSYTLTALDYYDQLFSAQMDAFRAYSDMAISQARTWLDVKDADSFKKAMESQQKTASDFMERVKGDTEKVTSISKSFAEDSQQQAEETTKNAVDKAEENTKSAVSKAKQ
ncbi:phasin family protein [Vreelandella maris]|uniref:Phasin family protein n=1 Tax=Vreelandella maris TaxID=2729617 RepID=A0A7Y6V7T8_9GAMM|nr:phasin family protein [Halomonas maris]NVF13215.1 phasin family protein [Halomonas maris]